jgi:hypothetical protein
MRFVAIVTLALASLAAALPAIAQQEDPYLADRSTPQALVKSLYNAINRKEFARAYSYFAVPPSPSLDAYAKGYADTEGVTLVVGTPASEGAAGSTFYSLPVAISSVGANEQIFAGCYTMRLANPQIQGEPYQPLSIEKGTLSAASGPIDSALPASCGDGPPLPPQNALLERARAKFLATRLDSCQPEEGDEPQVHDISFRYTSDTDDEPEREATLIRIFCSRGAYNEIHVYYLANDIGDLRELHFATPELDIHYEDGDSDKKVENINVVGFTTADGLVNSEYDPDSKSIGSWSKWRGIGDASSIGKWIFRNGDFALVKFEVDASYDGEVEHQTVVDYDTGP